MKHFLISLYRNIKRNPFITLINIWGMVLGFVCVIFIVLWTRNELSYDNFHKNSKHIYRVHRYWYDSNGSESLHLPYVAPPIAPLLRTELPEIQSIARVYHMDMVFSAGDKTLVEDNVFLAEPDVLKLFDFEGLPADTGLLTGPFTVIISDEAAYRYFNSRDVTGKNLEFKVENGNKYALQITGVFKKWQGNSHFNTDFFISFSTAESFFGKDEFKNWGSNNYETFALIPHLPAGIDKKLDDFMDKNLERGSKWTKIRLEGLTDIHFNWYGSRSYVYILLSIALLILIIGSINYMNLNAAIYLKRIKEIKIKKIIGASQRKLALQLLSESVLFCFISLIIAVFLTSLVSELIKITDKPLVFRISENLGIIAGFVALSSITGVLSGIYPVLVLSRYKPVTSSSTENVRTRRTFFRNSLVVFQFVVSTGLIISFLLVSRQLDFLNKKDLGLEKENIIVIPATPLLIEKLDVFKQQLTQDPNIISVSASKRVPSEGLLDSNGATIISDGEATPLGFRLANIRVDKDFINTYKIHLAAGRNFNEKISSGLEYMVNAAAVNKIGWKTPEVAIGRVIEYGGKRGTVTGVVSDFHYESLHSPINPIIMFVDPQSFNRVAIRVSPTEIKKTLSLIEKTWLTYNVSDYPFSYEYLSDRFKKLYSPEERIRLIFSYFMLVAISIAILGMIGLSVFLTERRTKEIGIRKINGASVWNVIYMLNKNFVKWVAIALVIAIPIAYLAMNKWLEDFAFKTELSWSIFVMAGIIALGIALLTVSWQSWKAAIRNPVDALRSE